MLVPLKSLPSKSKCLFFNTFKLLWLSKFSKMTIAKCNRCLASASGNTFVEASAKINHAVGLSRGVKCGDNWNQVYEVKESTPKPAIKPDTPTSTTTIEPIPVPVAEPIAEPSPDPITETKPDTPPENKPRKGEKLKSAKKSKKE